MISALASSNSARRPSALLDALPFCILTDARGVSKVVRRTDEVDPQALNLRVSFIVELLAVARLTKDT